MRLLRYVIGIILILAAGAGGTLLWLTRDTAPTHPTLAEADLPDIIPVRHFWANTGGEWSYAASLDGTYLSYRAVRGATEVLIVQNRDTGEDVLVLEDVDFSFWSDVAPLILVSIDGRLWQIDPGLPTRDFWRDVTPRGFGGWSIDSAVKAQEDRWIVSSRDRNPAFADIYTTRQDGGGRELLILNEGRTLSWHFDTENHPHLRFDRLDNDQVEVLALDDPESDEWRQVTVIDPDEAFWIIESTPDREHVIAISSRGRDKSAIVRMAVADGAEEVIASDPVTDLYEVYNLDPFDGLVDLVATDAPGGGLTALSPRGEILKSAIEGLGQRMDIDGLTTSGDGRFVTMTLSPEAKSYIYMLFDLESGETTQLGTFNFLERHGDKLSSTEEVTIPARDGLDIPALLLRPQGTDGPVPMVVEVHGGPADHVTWGYGHGRQFLVNRGYAVLSVNFRGSTGYGRAFQRAGYGEYGRAMQTDLYDAAQWAIDQGIADPDAIAVQGGSYGGYASAMAATDPESPFSAAIIQHAVLDMEYQMRNNPFAWGLNDYSMERYFGRLDNEDDLQAMRTYSPINRVEDLSMPVLLIAGKRDSIVGFEQTEEFLARVEELGKDTDALIFEDEGHGVAGWQNSIRLSRKGEDFLAEHLGGRSGGWDIIEGVMPLLE